MTEPKKYVLSGPNGADTFRNLPEGVTSVAERTVVVTLADNDGAGLRVDDAVESEEIFSTLMGDSVEARRKFITDHALDATNLDI